MQHVLFLFFCCILTVAAQNTGSWKKVDWYNSSTLDYIDVDYSPDGLFFVTGSADGVVALWNATTRIILVNVTRLNQRVTSVSISPNNKYVTAGFRDDTIGIYHAMNLTAVKDEIIIVDVGAYDLVEDVQFSPNSAVVAVSIGRSGSGNGATNGQVKFINTLNSREAGNPINPDGKDQFYSSAFSPSGEMIAVATWSMFYIVNVSSRATLSSIALEDDRRIDSIAWSPQGNYIAVCCAYFKDTDGGKFNMYRFLNSDNVSLVWQKDTTTSCMSTDFSHDGQKVVAGFAYLRADGNTAKIYDSDNGIQSGLLSGPQPDDCPGVINKNKCGTIKAVAWGPDSSTIISVHTRYDKGIYYWSDNFQNCIGDWCGTGCDGDSCAVLCKGTSCGADCRGKKCAAGCNGTKCGNYCVGDECALNCSGIRCGEFSMYFTNSSNSPNEMKMGLSCNQYTDKNQCLTSNDDVYFTANNAKIPDNLTMCNYLFSSKKCVPVLVTSTESTSDAKKNVNPWIIIGASLGSLAVIAGLAYGAKHFKMFAPFTKINSNAGFETLLKL